MPGVPNTPGPRCGPGLNVPALPVCAKGFAEVFASTKPCVQGRDTTKHHSTESTGAGCSKGWGRATDPGGGLSNLTSCDPTNTMLFTTGTHFTVENTLKRQCPVKKRLPRGVTRGQRQCGVLAHQAGRGRVFPARGSGKAQFEDSPDLRIRGWIWTA